MEIKNISYFRQDISTNESIRILDCGYHETIKGTTMFSTVLSAERESTRFMAALTT